MNNNIHAQLLELSACTRAVQMWFQAAHHLTKGKGFAGDHNLLYSEIYEYADDEFDGYVERNIGLTSFEESACPIMIAQQAIQILNTLPDVVNQTDFAIACCALTVAQKHLEKIESTYHLLQSNNEITLGLDDMLMSNANDYERFVYLLRMRSKESFNADY